MLFNAALFFLLVLAIVVFLRICYAGPFDLATLLCSEIFQISDEIFGDKSERRKYGKPF